MFFFQKHCASAPSAVLLKMISVEVSKMVRGICLFYHRDESVYNFLYVYIEIDFETVIT